VLEGGKVGFSSPGDGRTRLGPSEGEGTSLGVDEGDWKGPAMLWVTRIVTGLLWIELTCGGGWVSVR
jgi:hypothetical protein